MNAGEKLIGSESSTSLSICGKTVDLENVFQSGRKVLVSLSGEKDDVISVEVSESTVYIVARKQNLKFVAQVRHQELKIEIQTKDADGNYIQDVPTGQQFVDAAIQFLTEHNRIVTFTGIWRKGSDNYRDYQKSMQENMAPDEAAFSTWSGQNIAEKHGFHTIFGQIEEVTDTYPRVIVHFKRD